MNDDRTCDIGGCCPDHDVPALPGDRDEAVAMLAKALAHPVRVRILRILLARTSCTCGEVVAELPLAQATVSQHLKILKEAGLVLGRVDGPRSCYCANPAHLAHLADLVGDLVDTAPVPA
jgi:ArsR family transcriptional regulator